MLHWNFSVAERTIAFAVNVSTTGWVGFGVSPNGGMPNSDVVIGWVRNGRVYFQVSPHEIISTAWSDIYFLACSSITLHPPKVYLQYSLEP